VGPVINESYIVLINSILILLHIKQLNFRMNLLQILYQKKKHIFKIYYIICNTLFNIFTQLEISIRTVFYCVEDVDFLLIIYYDE